MAYTRLNFVNTRGIPCLETVGCTLTTEGETYSFNQHPYVSSFFQGVLVIKVSGTQTAPTTAVPIKFNTIGLDNTSVPVTNSTGAGYTTSDWPGDGVYLFFYDRATNVLRLLSNV